MGELDKDKVEEHESYGMVGFSRISCGAKDFLFGSSVKHNNVIRLRVATASRTRHLANHWYHAKKNIVEVDLSPTQFADLLTSMNMGDGIPCTLRYVNGKRMPDCPAYDQKAQFEDEFAATVKEANQQAANLIAEADVILNKPTINKGDREALRNLMSRISRKVTDSMPFIQGEFNEAMDKTVTEAKGEVDAFIQNKIISLGVEALRDEINEKRVEFIETESEVRQLT